MSPKSVSILYSDSKFERIRFYLAESDIDDLDDLALFNFDKLLFVPGVSEALIIEAKELFRSNQQHALKSDEAVVGEAYVCEEKGKVTDEVERRDCCARSAQSVASFRNDRDGKQHFVRSIRVSNLPLSVRAKNALTRAGILALGQLSALTREELMGIKNLGKKTCTEILELRDNIGSWSDDVLALYGTQERSLKSPLHSSIRVSKCPLSVRARNALARAGILTLEQLFALTREDLLSIQNIGRMTCDEIIRFTDSADFQNERTEQQSIDHFSYVSELPLSVRARNALGNAGISTLEQLLALTREELMGIKNLGAKTCNEIVQFRENAGYQYKGTLEPYFIQTIADENKPIPIRLLENIGVSMQEIEQLVDEGLTTLGDVQSHPLSPKRYSVGRTIERCMKAPISQYFSEKIEQLREAEHDVLIGRVAGFTLEEIGQELGITRERVRQLFVRVNSKLLPVAELVAGAILSTDGVAFPLSVLEDFFPDKGLAECCIVVLKSSEYVRYLEFCGKFATATVYPQDVENEVYDLLARVIGNGTNFYDSLEILRSELAKLGLGFLSLEDIMNLALSNNYRFYGDFVTKGRQPYAVVCHDAIIKFFDFKIKLNGDVDNEDMKRLRGIITRHYGGFRLPDNNRALTAGLTRDDSKLILAGRSQYCPIDKVIYRETLFKDICHFIRQAKQTTFYYLEIFESFKGRLLAESNIDNHQFLHGMLRYLYPTEFKYERDLMYKVGETRQDVDDRLNVLLLQKGSPVTLDEAKRAVPGIKNYTVAFSAMRLPKVIQWDYNEYNHMDNIKFTEREKAIISRAITDGAQRYNGYLSEGMLFGIVRGFCADFLDRNSIRNPQNLFYVATYMFADRFRFRRPHILLDTFPVEQITSANIVGVLLDCRHELDYEEFVNLTDKLEWSSGTRYGVFSEITEDYIRISENRYVRKSRFEISASALHVLAKHLEIYMPSGYFALGSIFDFERFPKCSFEWNGFLLQSIILEYETGYRLISPQIRDRRYHREIIVRNASPHETFEDLVLATLRTDQITSLSEQEFRHYLKLRGLIVTSVIPQELYRCPSIAFRNERFYFN